MLLEAFCLPLGHVAQGALRAAVRQLAALVGVGAHLARANLWPTAVANGITGSKHASHAINSLCHATGASDGRADHDAIDRPLLALLNGGEGFHKPHHDDPHLAQHGPWYADSTYLLIALLERAGLVWGVQRRPRAKAKES